MIRLILLFISAILMTGCSLIFEDPDAPCPVVEESTDSLNLSFYMYVPVDDKSRTDDKNHQEVPSENPAFEDLIYADDLCFFIYAAANGDTPAFIKKVHKGSEIDDANTYISGGMGEYIVRVSIAKKDFDSVVPVNGNDVTFRVVAFANTNKKYETLAAGDYSTYGNLITAASGWDFNIFGTVYSEAEPGKLAGSPRIPMYGTVNFTASRARLNKSTLATPVWSEEPVSLLRSLAKVKVVDNITKFDAVYPYIKSVTFNTRTTAYILLKVGENYVKGNQVDKVGARPYSDEEQLKGLTLLPNAENNLWAGYVPEQVINPPYVSGVSVPYLNITVALWKDKDGNEDIKEYIVPMTGYNNKNFDFGEYILRNHIYTLEVSMKATLDVTVVLAPYRLCVLEPDFGLPPTTTDPKPEETL
ncbi:MAG: hypothetical protein K2M00_05750 [Muribaculaceae bacterium]|nr:hypothetical protein [Muribaculaceae bacterium]